MAICCGLDQLRGRINKRRSDRPDSWLLVKKVNLYKVI